MNAPQSSRRPTAAVVVQSMLWLWLLGLSVIVALGYQAMSDQADQERLDSRLQRLEAQAVALAEAIEHSSSVRPSQRRGPQRHPPNPGSTRFPG